ncbi:MAG: hypothetical protein WA005_05095 [Candidatus Binataceae bacterium]
MKLRHAAALALVGWYLMVPPGEKSGLPPDAPLSQWRHIASFDSAGQCEHSLNELRRDFSAETKAAIKAWHACDRCKDQRLDRVVHTLAAEQTAKAGQCIASDDPRLMGK